MISLGEHIEELLKLGGSEDMTPFEIGQEALWGPLSRVESMRRLRRVRERVAPLAPERRTG